MVLSYYRERSNPSPAAKRSPETLSFQDFFLYMPAAIQKILPPGREIIRLDRNPFPMQNAAFPVLFSQSAIHSASAIASDFALKITLSKSGENQ